MKAEQLVCPHCHQSVRDAGVVKVESGLTQFQSFYYHPHAQCFMFDNVTEQGNGAAIIRSMARPLPSGPTRRRCSGTRWPVARAILAHASQSERGFDATRTERSNRPVGLLVPRA